MIYVDLKGNLGNQMFIYAFARKLQSETSQDIYFSKHNLEKYFPDYKCSLQEFKLNEHCYIGNKKLPFFMNDNFLPIKLFNRIFKGRLKNLLEKLYFKILFDFGFVFWESTSYIDIDYKKLKSKKNIYVNGFWQSSKYFDDIKEILKKELTPKIGIEDKNKELYNKIIHTNSVCVSIRRGDFVSNPKISQRYYLCDQKYFEKAIKIIEEKNKKDIVIFCFSDDINWVMENVKFNRPTYYESGNDTVSQKILLMSLCKNFVLSNSSFSWWVNYLSVNSNITVAPSRWYADGSGKDIYQKEWEIIPVGGDLNNE